MISHNRKTGRLGFNILIQYFCIRKIFLVQLVWPCILKFSLAFSINVSLILDPERGRDILVSFMTTMTHPPPSPPTYLLYIMLMFCIIQFKLKICILILIFTFYIINQICLTILHPAPLVTILKWLYPLFSLEKSV